MKHKFYIISSEGDIDTEEFDTTDTEDLNTLESFLEDDGDAVDFETACINYLNEENIGEYNQKFINAIVLTEKEFNSMVEKAKTL